MVRVTVHEVAATAGVSLATVDRVLNRRPGVRAETIARVERAMDRLGYRRDRAAANLARRRQYTITFIIPHSDNAFMSGLAAQVVNQTEAMADERVRATILPVPPLDERALVAALNSIDPATCNGVALVATEGPAARDAIDRLVERGVGVVTLVSDLSASRRSHYVGIDNAAAGRTAASLLGRLLRGLSGPVAVVAGSMTLRDHAERAMGFAQVLASEFANLHALPMLAGRDDPKQVEALVDGLIAEHPELLGIYSLGAGNSGLLAALKRHQLAGRIPVVAHELTAISRAALLEGSLDAVLCQDPAHEVRSAVRLLQALVDGSPIQPEQERIRIDIYLRDNLP
jgi:LacI family transcriptional regulator